MRGSKPSNAKLLKLSNAYREDRHSGRKNVLPALTTIDTPKELTRKKVKEYWQLVTTELIACELITLADVPTLISAFFALQEADKLQEEIEIEEITERRIQLQKAWVMMMKVYNDTMMKFGITAESRNRMKFISDSMDSNEASPVLKVLNKCVGSTNTLKK